MSKCMCVNLDKNEFFEFGEFPACSYRDSDSCNTIEYFLATEWSGDNVVFTFNNTQKNNFAPNGYDGLYECAIKNFDERFILKSVPAYRYLVNTTKGIYLDKEQILEGDDGTYFNPVSMLLSTEEDKEVIGIECSLDEEKLIGSWIFDKIVAVNNLNNYPGYSCMTVPFKNEGTKSGKSLSGSSFAITGTMSRDRFSYIRLITEYGGIYKNNVTKNTDYLIVGHNPGNSKIDKARQYGIPEISEKEFFDMLNKGGV